MTEGFDVFLSYNRRAVEPLAMTLCDRRLKVFKDSWFWRPGKFWPAALETKLKASAAVIVPVGGNGLGGWQQREVASAIDC